MKASSDGFKSTIGKKSTSDFIIGSSLSENMSCMKPDQFGLGFAFSLIIQPDCKEYLSIIAVVKYKALVTQ